MKSEKGEGLVYGIFKINNYKVIKGKVHLKIKSDDKYYAMYFGSGWAYRHDREFEPLIFKHDYMDISKEIII